MKNKIMNQVIRAKMAIEEAKEKVFGILKDDAGENYVDTAVKILIAVVLGALLLAGLYALFGDVVMPTLRQRVVDMFNYRG